jgi:hypothetical protein
VNWPWKIRKKHLGSHTPKFYLLYQEMEWLDYGIIKGVSFTGHACDNAFFSSNTFLMSS